ncbi:MAG: RHS repeat-associated core domain-containing protein [Spirosomataceae bacterium]
MELGGSHQNLKQQFEYKFNGKQENGFKGLTDFGGRYLDRHLGVWAQVDPLTEKFTAWSPYSAMANNQIIFFDADGREPVPSYQRLNPWFTLKPTQWYSTAGIYDNNTFNAAAAYSTQHLRADAFQSVYQRNAYYGWVQSQADAKGYGSKWFGAAELVTGLNAVGATETINLGVIKDNTEAFLKGGNQFLFSHNMKNAKDLLANGKLSGGFIDANGANQLFEGLTGMALDLKMVEFEQSKVQEYINGYKGNDLNSIIGNINQLFTGDVAKYAGPGAIKDVMKESFNGGKSFNFKNYADRVKLGKELIKKAHHE